MEPTGVRRQRPQNGSRRRLQSLQSPSVGQRGPPPTALSVLGHRLVPPRGAFSRGPPRSCIKAAVLLQLPTQAAGPPALTLAGPAVRPPPPIRPAGLPDAKARVAQKHPAAEPLAIMGHVGGHPLSTTICGLTAAGRAPAQNQRRRPQARHRLHTPHCHPTDRPAPLTPLVTPSSFPIQENSNNKKQKPTSYHGCKRNPNKII
ncbi:hypothetical protein NDU88_004142 [Pleurodeles waltl]|uniref:Uncharacterized protein n=1 Tax=Pleurodeles waltl TaxID=8319 RepID=A0AAV7VJ30_PLEWA|nr:hypothetical protein NDU88_004142 [Pleurodeles waltl]